MSVRSLLPVVARPLLASIFVVGGLDAFRNPESKAPAAGSLLGPVAERLPDVGTADLVKADAALKIGAGVTLGLGILPRVSALALAASLVPTTFVGHAFWKHDDPEKRAAQRIQLAKNASTLGGLLLVIASER